MKDVKRFIAGIAFPSTILPFIILNVWFFGKTAILSQPLLHFIPLAWGVWNVLYFSFFTKILPGSSTSKLLITGAVLGFLVAAYGVFMADIPRLLGFPPSLTYLPLVIGPILYAIFWLFIVRPLNHLLGVYDD